MGKFRHSFALVRDADIGPTTFRRLGVIPVHLYDDDSVSRLKTGYFCESIILSLEVWYISPFHAPNSSL